MKQVLLIHLDGNKSTIDPVAIIKVVPFGDHAIVETMYGNVTVKSDKQTIENAIHNCYLP